MTIEKNVIPLSENISDDPKKFLVIGWTVVLLGLAIFIFWAAFAPLDKGVPAIGNVAISGNKKVYSLLLKALLLIFL